MHTRACAESREGPETCTCVCGGTLHGSAWRQPFSDGEPAVRRQSKARRRVGLAITFAVTLTIGPFAFNAVFGGSPANGGGLSVQVKTDLNKAVVALTAIGFRGARGPSHRILGPSYNSDCAISATGKVKQFLTFHPCEQYATASRAITKRKTTALVAFVWVEMPTVYLGNQYKNLVDEYGTGNPPGMSRAFSGLCYASGQSGTIVWTVQVEPTGHVNADRRILQAAVNGTLAPSYLREHCVS
jgi:hypothetical protein